MVNYLTNLTATRISWQRRICSMGLCLK